MTDGFDGEVDALYALDPAEFTAARNALVKRMKAAGQRDAAAVVAKLKRPTPGAWALDQVARGDPALVTAALDAGERLRQATDAAVDGDASGLRSASADERAASGALVEAALGRLGSGGATVRSRLVATVHAAAVDHEVADRLRRGVLAADEDRAGLGFGLDAPSGPAAPARPRPARSPRQRHLAAVAAAPDETAAAERERALAARRSAAAAARAEAEQLASGAAAAEDRAAAALADADAADQRAVEARQAADEADQRAAGSRTAAEGASREAADARRAADEADRVAADAERAVDP